MIFTKLSRYFHTIRYLKLSQIIWRVFRRFKLTDTSKQELIAERETKNKWHEIRLSEIHIVDELGFNFLNDKHIFEDSVDWNDKDREMLWLFNLHYFDDLNAPIDCDKNLWLRNLVNDWIFNNPPLSGVGWESYPLSLRIVNWIKWILNGEPTNDLLLDSLKVQANILSQNIEYHLYGNHILANAKALIFAGLFFKGEKAEKWLKLGLEIYDAQLNEQVLSDGGHFELSPMYQNIILNDLLDLINLAGTYNHLKLKKYKDIWKSKASSMLLWANTMSHPDGEISFFNDAAFGIAPPYKSLLKYANAVGVKNDFFEEKKLSNTEVVHLMQSGYLCVEQKNLFAILDCAAIGPDYLPGHGHADSLSFELSLYGHRVLVNSGVSRYGVSDERVHERGTSAHNTVRINGLDSSEVWSGFRVAKRAYPFDLLIDEGDDEVNISCSHDGYKRLRDPVIHNRLWCFSQNLMTISDQLIGDFKTAEVFYLFHPSIIITEIQNNYIITLPNLNEIMFEVIGGETSLIETYWNPEFGKSISTKCILILALSDKISVSITGYTSQNNDLKSE